MKWLFGALAVAYPFLVYFGLLRYSPGVVGIVLAVVAVARVAVVEATARKTVLPGAIGLFVMSAAVMVTDSELLLRLYPVAVSSAMLGWFVYTLVYPPTAIERFMAPFHIDIEPYMRPYLRGMTMVWASFFVLNGLVALWTALEAKLALWALYNGFISYLIMGLLIVLELFFVRRVYRRRLERRLP